jgi:FkbM family methyltransferase
MKPDLIKSKYLKGELDKPTFIEHMSAEHACLFSYARLIEETNIAAVRILPGGVRVSLKWPPVELSIPEGEMRAAPVEALNFGDYESHEFAVVESLVGQLPVEEPVLFDIGGNVGFYSIGLKKLHPRLCIHAFEPVPTTAAQFRINCAINNCGQITLHEVALSDSEGELTLHVHPACSVAASAANILESDQIVEVICPRHRLDQYARNLAGPVDFIKCDVEGGEWAVFRGAEALLRRDQPVVFAEMLRKWSAVFGYHPNDLIRFFAGLGYQCHAISTEKTRLITQVDDSTIETNFIFLHTDKHEGLRLHC